MANLLHSNWLAYQLWKFTNLAAVLTSMFQSNWLFQIFKFLLQCPAPNLHSPCVNFVRFSNLSYFVPQVPHFCNSKWDKFHIDPLPHFPPVRLHLGQVSAPPFLHISISMSVLTKSKYQILPSVNFCLSFGEILWQTWNSSRVGWRSECWGGRVWNFSRWDLG